ncbi:MAG: RdgB/HAM1 family non-canonical purine NTP pyrophosphatase [Anaerolineaceae bacterium]
MQQLLLATNNPHKVTEMVALLDGLSVHVVTPNDLGITLEVEEDGQTYLENALLKAIAFSKTSGLPVLSDDSGLEVDALGGVPGLHSHRLIIDPNATGHERCLRLLELLADKPKPWSAKFRSEVVLMRAPEDWVSASGICLGEIQDTFSGSNGFGYDPIFRIAGSNKTMADLPDSVKNQISHRARAIQALMPELIRFSKETR